MNDSLALLLERAAARVRQGSPDEAWSAVKAALAELEEVPADLPPLGVPQPTRRYRCLPIQGQVWHVEGSGPYVLLGTVQVHQGERDTWQEWPLYGKDGHLFTRHPDDFRKRMREEP